MGIVRSVIAENVVNILQTHTHDKDVKSCYAGQMAKLFFVNQLYGG